MDSGGWGYGGVGQLADFESREKICSASPRLDTPMPPYPRALLTVLDCSNWARVTPFFDYPPEIRRQCGTPPYLRLPTRPLTLGQHQQEMDNATA